jgi:hypothetical protein
MCLEGINQETPNIPSTSQYLLVPTNQSHFEKYFFGLFRTSYFHIIKGI